MKKPDLWWLSISCFLLLWILSGCSTGKQPPAGALSGELIVFHAGSLSVPFKELADSFMVMHPGVKVLTESAGSLASIRKITDLHKPCDLLASADFTLIDQLLIPEYASWNLQFAGNELAVVYQPESAHAAEVNAGNWHRILLLPDVKTGRSDPDSDPCGYRTVLSLKLASAYYQQADLYLKMLEKDKQYIRPKEVDLLALLESGTIDYIFIYKSVALQHKLPFVELPDEINLGSYDQRDVYSTVSTQVAGNTPDEKITVKGEPMIYGITVPENAPNKKAALAFIELLMGTTGKEILLKSGQNPLAPQTSQKTFRLPEELKSLARE